MRCIGCGVFHYLREFVSAKGKRVKKCSGCRETERRYYLAHRQKIIDRAATYCAQHPERARQWARKSRAGLRGAALGVFGSACKTCGETDGFVLRIAPLGVCVEGKHATGRKALKLVIENQGRGYRLLCTKCLKDEQVFMRKNAVAANRQIRAEKFKAKRVQFLSDPASVKSCTKCARELALSSFYPKGRTQQALRPVCKECHYDATKRWAKANPEKLKAVQKRSYERHAEKRRAYAATWAARNPEKVTARNKNKWATRKDFCQTRYREWRSANPEKAANSCKKWREANLEKAKAKSRETAKRWKRKNRAKARSQDTEREVRKALATPRWARYEVMEIYYQLAAFMTASTGQRYSVDHIVPLKSKKVCGLHTQSNLAVITESENSSKGNRFWPGMTTDEAA